VHGVTHGAAIATRIHPAFALKYIDQQIGRLLDSLQSRVVGEQGIQRLLRFDQAGVDVLLQV
jgi:hypothetical protein